MDTMGIIIVIANIETNTKTIDIDKNEMINEIYK